MDNVHELALFNAYPCLMTKIGYFFLHSLIFICILFNGIYCVHYNCCSISFYIDVVSGILEEHGDKLCCNLNKQC